MTSPFDISAKSLFKKMESREGCPSSLSVGGKVTQLATTDGTFNSH